MCVLQATEVDVVDVKKVYSLFVDVNRSAAFLTEFQKHFVFK
jgi:RuvB-like protein 2